MRPYDRGTARLSRRQFLVGGAGLVVSLANARRPLAARAASVQLPAPARSGLDHIVVVMLENRSFDHLLGWLPNADGRQEGLSYLDVGGAAHSTYSLAPDFQGCGYADPDHSYEGGRMQFDEGACDGWLLTGSGDLYPIGYYTQRDLPFLGQAAPRWTVCDRYFAAFMGPTIPNRLYLHCGVTDRVTSTIAPSSLPTIWDRLAQKRVARRYYFQNLPFLALWGNKYLSITKPFARFLTDCRSGTLPGVAFVDPLFTATDEGTAADDHPHADIRAGEYFLNRVYRAVTTSPAWPRTLLVITFDEWGGFFDHVRPSTAPEMDSRYALRGFRVPCLLISPFARRGYVAHGFYDHTSLLRLIEWRFGLKPLSVRDRTANNIANALNFTQANLKAPHFSVPKLIAGGPC
jgi:phospholipase C